MNPLQWRDRARRLLSQAPAQERFFVRFARAGEETLFITDAAQVQALDAAGFVLQARKGRLVGFDPPEQWYRALEGQSPKSAACNEAAALAWRLRRAPGEITAQGQAFLRRVAWACFAPGAWTRAEALKIRAQAAVLLRTKDTGAFAAAAGLLLAAAGEKEEEAR